MRGFTIVRGELAVHFTTKTKAQQSLPAYPGGTIVRRTETAYEIARKRAAAVELGADGHDQR
jgi:hypothetical protein